MSGLRDDTFKIFNSWRGRQRLNDEAFNHNPYTLARLRFTEGGHLQALQGLAYEPGWLARLPPSLCDRYPRVIGRLSDRH